MQPRRVYCRWVASERGCPRAAANKEDHLIAATAFGRHTASCFLFRPQRRQHREWNKSLDGAFKYSPLCGYINSDRKVGHMPKTVWGLGSRWSTRSLFSVRTVRSKRFIGRVYLRKRSASREV